MKGNKVMKCETTLGAASWEKQQCSDSFYWHLALGTFQMSHQSAQALVITQVYIAIVRLVTDGLSEVCSCVLSPAESCMVILAAFS